MDESKLLPGHMIHDMRAPAWTSKTRPAELQEYDSDVCGMGLLTVDRLDAGQPIRK